MAGPIDAMKAYTSKYVKIKPGFTKKEAIAKQILAKINEDDIIRILPSGKNSLKNSLLQSKLELIN